MKSIATFLIPLALFVGCSTLSPEAKLDQDKRLFGEIVAFHRMKNPDKQFMYPKGLLTSGPIEEMWVRIGYPSELESHYFHDFSRDYLQQELESDDDLRKIVANDLLLLKNPIKSKQVGLAVVRVDRGLTKEEIEERRRPFLLDLERMKSKATEQRAEPRSAGDSSIRGTGLVTPEK